MTRKDYIRFEAMLKDMHVATNPLQSRPAITEVSIRAADIFAADNARFDRAKFLKACGVES
jgi:hypothetical protein